MSDILHQKCGKTCGKPKGKSQILRMPFTALKLLYISLDHDQEKVHSIFTFKTLMAAEQCIDQDFLSNLSKVNWRPNVPLYQWKGYWLMPELLKSVMAIHSQFKPLPSDVVIASFPKTGTTWLKALTVSILNHNSLANSDPLQANNPHELVPMLELEIYNSRNPQNRHMENMPSPRLYNTHLPLSLLPESIMKSGCRVIYIARNPMDTLVSCWHFFNRMYGSNLSLEEAYEEFCKGTVPGGPFFDHVLEYFNEREKDNVFFITYEELKEDTNRHVKRLAEFLGCSLNSNEINEVARRSSHDRLSKLDVNKNNEKVHFTGIEYGSFFRRGVVGDYKNHLTPKMVEGINSITKQKLEGSGLQFILPNIAKGN